MLILVLALVFPLNVFSVWRHSSRFASGFMSPDEEFIFANILAGPGWTQVVGRFGITEGFLLSYLCRLLQRRAAQF